MVVERRLSILISAAVAFILLTALWNVFVRPGHRVRAGPVPDAPTILESVHTGDSAARAAAAAPPPVSTLSRIVGASGTRSEEHTSELQSQSNIVCRLLLEKK